MKRRKNLFRSVPKHTTYLHVRLPPSEKYTIDKAARRAGRGASQWIREVLMAAAVGTRKKDPHQLLEETMEALERAMVALTAFVDSSAGG